MGRSDGWLYIQHIASYPYQGRNTCIVPAFSMYFQCGRKASKTKHNKHTPRCTCTASNALPSSFLMHEGVLPPPGHTPICFSNHRCGLRSDWGLQLRNCSLKRSVIRREIKFKSYQFDISSGTDENPSGEKLLPRARMQKSEFFMGNSFTEKQKEYIWNINLCFIVIFFTGYDTNLILLYLSVYRYLFGFMQKKNQKKKTFF